MWQLLICQRTGSNLRPCWSSLIWQRIPSHIRLSTRWICPETTNGWRAVNGSWTAILRRKIPSTPSELMSHDVGLYREPTFELPLDLHIPKRHAWKYRGIDVHDEWSILCCAVTIRFQFGSPRKLNKYRGNHRPDRTILDMNIPIIFASSKWSVRNHVNLHDHFGRWFLVSEHSYGMYRAHRNRFLIMV